MSERCNKEAEFFRPYIKYLKRKRRAWGTIFIVRLNALLDNEVFADERIEGASGDLPLLGEAEWVGRGC